ncbi:MAG: 4Fe-4S dicluster domain-containing protein [candidate division WOR-3 bacterium]
MSYQKSGVLTEKDLKQNNLLPSNERFDKGPVVIIECIEKIPCNPCVAACPQKAISIEGSIIEIPKINFDICSGCGICIARCPGLAIFVVHKHFNKTESAISLPYEFLPRPQKGQIVKALDRRGKVVCHGRVEKVIDTKALDRCAIVTIAIPKKYYNKVRFFKLK